VPTTANACNAEQHDRFPRHFFIFEQQVNPCCASLNHHDAFVLDDGKGLFVFVGRSAARLKHAKAFEIAIRIKDSEYHGGVSIVDVHGTSARSSSGSTAVIGSSRQYSHRAHTWARIA
jgi:hypothetical protein